MHQQGIFSFCFFIFKRLFFQHEGHCLRPVCGERRVPSCPSWVWRGWSPERPRPPLGHGTVRTPATWAPPPAPEPRSAAACPWATASIWAPARPCRSAARSRAPRPNPNTSDLTPVSASAARLTSGRADPALLKTRGRQEPWPLTSSVLERRWRLSLWRLMIKVLLPLPLAELYAFIQNYLISVIFLCITDTKCASH